MPDIAYTIDLKTERQVIASTFKSFYVYMQTYNVHVCIQYALM